MASRYELYIYISELEHLWITWESSSRCQTSMGQQLTKPEGLTGSNHPHGPCKLKVLPQRSSGFHNPQSNVLQFLPYSSPAALENVSNSYGPGFSRRWKNTKMKVLGGWWCLLYVFFLLPFRYLFMIPNDSFQEKYLPSEFQDNLCWSAKWKAIVNQWVISWS